MTTLTEHQLQKSIIAECNLRANLDPRWARVFAVPNGGQRDVRVAMKLKAEGVRAGVPDLLWPLKAHGYIGLALELKVKKNKASQLQSDWLRWLSEQGWYTAVVHDDPQVAMDCLTWYLDGAA